MAFLDPNPKENILDSPGSSVFDLPTQLSPDNSKNKTNAQLDFRGGTSASNSRVSVDGVYTPGFPQEDGTSFLIISGGTGCNSICSAFGNAATYVLPVSDDGGSSSEIIRVIGGPSVGKQVMCYYSLIQFCNCAQWYGCLRYSGSFERRTARHEKD